MCAHPNGIGSAIIAQLIHVHPLAASHALVHCNIPTYEDILNCLLPWANRSAQHTQQTNAFPATRGDKTAMRPVLSQAER